MASERLTWNEIKNKYIGCFVGLSDVEYNNQKQIASAIVKYSTNNMSYSDIMMKTLSEKIIVRNLNADIKGYVGINT